MKNIKETAQLLMDWVTPVTREEAVKKPDHPWFELPGLDFKKVETQAIQAVCQELLLRLEIEDGERAEGG